jgi:hypothetical protein
MSARRSICTVLLHLSPAPALIQESFPSFSPVLVVTPTAVLTVKATVGLAQLLD